MNIAAARDSRKIVDCAELLLRGDGLQNSQVERRTANAAAGETDSFQILVEGDSINVRQRAARWRVLRRPYTTGLHFLFQQPLARRVFQHGGESRLSSDVWLQVNRRDLGDFDNRGIGGRRARHSLPCLPRE